MISLDSETTGVDLFHEAKPFFITICNKDGKNTYWEADVDPLTREPQWLEADLEEIRQVLKKNKQRVLQNPRFDVRALETIEIDWSWPQTYDCLMAGHLLCSNGLHDLTSMSLIELGINIQPLEDILKVAVKEARDIAKKEFKDWKIAREGESGMPSAKGEQKDRKGKGVEGTSPWKFDMWLPRAIAKKKKYPSSHPWWTVLPDYSNMDSAVTLPLFLKQKEKLEQRDLWNIYLERLKLLPVVYKIENRGISFSQTRLKELRATYRVESAKCSKICTSIADSYDVKIQLPKSGANNSLKSFLFNTLKLPVLKNTKGGGACTDQKVRQQWIDSLPIRSKAYVFLKNLSQRGKYNTSLNYMDGYERFQLPWIPVKILNPKTGAGWYILHPSLNPTGTDTLRFSSSNPNAQNISKQQMEEDAEIGRTLRYIFGPLPGREWWSLDYENIELRIPAYESGERCMIELFEKPDEAPYFGSYHLLNASIIYPDLFWPLAEQKGAFKKKYAATWYQWDKNFGFAFQYSGGEQTCDAAAHKPGSWKLVKDNLKEHSKLNKRMVDFAEKHGYVETLPDKTVDSKHGYPVMCTRNHWGSIKGTTPLNYHVQSTAMQCTSKAMLRSQNYLDTLPDHHMILQVHDELVFDFPKGGRRNLPVVKKIQKLMEQSGDDIGIPLRVSITYHPNNWGEETDYNAN